MTLVVLALMPFMVLVVFGLNWSLARSLRSEMEAYSKAGAIADEVLAGIRTVAAFNAQPFEVGRYEAQLAEGTRMGVRKALAIGVFTALHIFLIFVSMSITFWHFFTYFCHFLALEKFNNIALHFCSRKILFWL
jgi:ABC-type bacteriocin/lantibiotic exporter with double-glycine peptidase domain